MNPIDMRNLAAGKTDLQMMAGYTENSIDALQAATLNLPRPTPGHRFDEFLSFHHWRYCPACLEENRPHKKSWLVAFATACTIHECELVDGCTSCGQQADVRSAPNLYCPKCRSFEKPVSADLDEVACTTAIEQVIDDAPELMLLLNRLMSAWFLSDPEALRPHHAFSPQLRGVDFMRRLVIQLWPAAQDENALAFALDASQQQLLNRWPRLPGVASMLFKRARRAGAHIPKMKERVKDVDLLDFSKTWWLPYQEAAQAAGISSHILKSLVDDGVVKSRLFTEISDDEERRRHRFRMVNLAHWNEIIETLYENAQEDGGRKGVTSILNVQTHQAITDALKGRLVLFRGPGELLSDLRVGYLNTTTAAWRFAVPDSAIRASEACELLGTYHDVVCSLISGGALQTHPHSSSRFLLIDRASAERFHRRYVLVGELAATHKMNATNLAEKLQAAGVEPAPIDALTSVFSRADVDEEVLEDIRDMSCYTAKTGRKSTVDATKVDCPRTRKLIALVNEHGGATEFTRKFGGSAGNLSMMMRGKKSFGPLAARRMEERCGLVEKVFSNS